MTDAVLRAPGHLVGVNALLAEVGLPPTAGDAEDYLVAEGPGGETVGSVGVETWGTSGLLRSLAVAPDARGAGLGGRLVEAAEALAVARGLDALYLLTTTAAPFFEARGYVAVDRAEVPEVVRRSSEFASVCPASAACRVKRLRPRPGRAPRS